MVSSSVRAGVGARVPAIVFAAGFALPGGTLRVMRRVDARVALGGEGSSTACTVLAVSRDSRLACHIGEGTCHFRALDGLASPFSGLLRRGSLVGLRLSLQDVGSQHRIRSYETAERNLRLEERPASASWPSWTDGLEDSAVAKAGSMDQSPAPGDVSVSIGKHQQAHVPHSTSHFLTARHGNGWERLGI